MSSIQDFQGKDPQIMLDWSDDKGKTWSTEVTASMGKLGEYGTRVIFRRLGSSRDRIFRVSISDPVKRVITSANLDAIGGIH